MLMNILRKLSTLIAAMTSRSTGERPVETIQTPQQDQDADLAHAAMSAQRAAGRRANAEPQPPDRSRVADLLERRENAGEDTPTQRKKGDRS
jgi:hypothetical protein